MVPSRVLERIAGIIQKSVEEVGCTTADILGIGIGCPGPVEWEKGIVRVAVNLGWKNTPVGDFLHDRFQCPVSVLNDVDAGVYGEYRFGAAAGSRCAVGIFPGTGIVCGCVYDGTILRGKLLTCMEIGHIRIGGGTRASGLTLAGTVESEASRLTIAAECAKLAYRGEAPNLLELGGTDLGPFAARPSPRRSKKGIKRSRRWCARQLNKWASRPSTSSTCWRPM